MWLDNREMQCLLHIAVQEGNIIGKMLVWEFYLLFYFLSTSITIPDMVVGMYIKCGTEIHCAVIIISSSLCNHKQDGTYEHMFISVAISRWMRMSRQLRVLEDPHLITMLSSNGPWKGLIKLEISIPYCKCKILDKTIRNTNIYIHHRLRNVKCIHSMLWQFWRMTTSIHLILYCKNFCC